MNDAGGNHAASRLHRLARASGTPCLGIFLIVLATIFVLRLEGRVWWCACGQPNLWSGDPQSSHSSQHLLDPYSFTHILHGVLICGLLAVMVSRLNQAWALTTAVLLEAL